MSELLIDFAIGVTMWGIAMFLANRFTKDKEINKAKYYTILVIVITALITFNNTYVQPKFNEWRNTNNIDSEFEKTVAIMEPYATLRTTFPEDYNKIKDVIINSLKAKDTREQAYQKGRPILMNIMMNKIKISSDEALTSLAKVCVDTANYFYSKGQADFAFDFIYNQKNMPRNWYDSLPKEFIDAEAACDKQILISAAQNKVYNIDTDKANKIFERIASELDAEHGDKVALIQTPLAHPDKKQEIAKITIDFYNKILKLPETDRGIVLRQLFAN